jgi:nucleoside-triphosphate--adenylate kinase
VTGEKLIKRDDDKETVVIKRLAEYRQRTEPVIAYYKQMNLLVEFSGRESNEIYPRVKNFLQEKIKLS